MQQVKVQGGVPLRGNVTLSGSKHSALAILGTILLMKGKANLKNFPDIEDTRQMLSILKSLGVSIEQDQINKYISLEIDTLKSTNEEMWRASKLRSSILFLGSILISQNNVVLPKPGGDSLGNRPMGEFLYVLSQFGIEYKENANTIEACLKNKLRGQRILDLCSPEFKDMGNNRTVLGLMLAWANRGRTIMKNSIILPEIIEICYFLEKMSNGYVTIDGVGTDTLIINSPGIQEIHKNNVCFEHTIGPDKCEYAFWIAATSLTKGKININNPYADRDYRNTMRWLRAKLLRQANIPMKVLSYGTYEIDSTDRRAKSFNLKSTAHELYGIAFDATPLFATILLNSEGLGSYYCFKFKQERVKWIKELHQIGVQFLIKPNGTLLVNGVEKLSTDKSIVLSGTDIRGASCVLLASLATFGEAITVQGIEHVQRGMEDPIEKLLALGSNIQIIDN